jgi:hypothetical protein
MEIPTTFDLRLATEEDIPALDALIEASVRGLQAGDYSQAQIEGSLGTVLGLDTQLIRDGTYFVAEAVCNDQRSPSELQEKFPSGTKAHLHFSALNVRAEARTLQEPLTAVASQPWQKIKYLPRMGHPISCVGSMLT